jgi:hypothetical protein
MRGEQHRSAKLTEADVREIRKSTEATATLAKRYAVAEHTLSLARRGITWRGVRP